MDKSTENMIMNVSLVCLVALAVTTCICWCKKRRIANQFHSLKNQAIQLNPAEFSIDSDDSSQEEIIVPGHLQQKSSGRKA